MKMNAIHPQQTETANNRFLVANTSERHKQNKQTKKYEQEVRVSNTQMWLLLSSQECGAWATVV